ncbi:glycosyltransferase family 2 protein [Psychromonas sp. RZ22]|uniref:glycosyltransferase n=1 Tax=Psychromonas algarum TaxID=2555643 RepID=UPI00106797FC|nr:glycosyltransferase family 2 protein [Psychromonas sp. RZ22]TEW56161.1 glycosyltransferase family 2 protein [Psychromonas sp. RZ22]
MMNVCIAICTYKRPEIKKTLISIAEQELVENFSIEIVVSDNDKTDVARDYIEKLSRELELKLIYIHAPQKNISIARNACLENSTSNWFLTIDDDQIVSNTWVSEMIMRAKVTSADAVFGPVIAKYPSNTPDWIKKGDFHSHKPVFINGNVETGYTGNTLIRLDSEFFKDKKFDLTLGRSGGEDSAYFSAAFQRGAKLEFAEKAVVFEPVPEQRNNFKWLIKRKFRYGQTSGAKILNSNKSTISFVLSILSSLSKVSFCLFMSAISVFNKTISYSWFLRGVLHIGVISKLLGKHEILQY